MVEFSLLFLQARPEHLTFINNYLHDSLASGISLKGADRIVVEGNVVQRAGYRGVGAGFDPYWWEVRDCGLLSAAPFDYSKECTCGLVNHAIFICHS